MSDWKKVLLAAGGAAAVGATVYYLRRQASQSASERPAADAGSLRSGTREISAGSSTKETSKEELYQILQEISKQQDEMKAHMRAISKEMLQKPMTLEQAYARVKQVQAEDPLIRNGLSMMDFNSLLDKHSCDATVREAIAKIMGAPDPSSSQSEQVQNITAKKIIEVHAFMLQELEAFVKEVESNPRKDLDMSTLTIVAQAIVGAKTEKSFQLTTDDIEAGVLMHHATLATDQEFSNINYKIQGAMAKVMGTKFSEFPQ